MPQKSATLGSPRNCFQPACIIATNVTRVIAETRLIRDFCKKNRGADIEDRRSLKVSDPYHS